MISIAKKKIISLTEALHLRIFGHAMSEEMRNFLGHLSWSMIGGIGASAILFLVNVVAGRYLGPEMYGKYNSAISLASVLSVLFLFSFDTASVRYLADKEYSEISDVIFTSVFSFVFLWSGFLAVLLIIFINNFFPSYFETQSYIYWIVALAFLLSFKTLFNGFLRAFHKIKSQSLNRIFDAVSVAVFLGYLIFKVRNASYISYIEAVIIGSLIFIILSLYILKDKFFRFEIDVLLKMFKEYSRFLLAGSGIGMLMLGDKFIIGRLVGPLELGYFSAYFTASHVVVAELSGIFMNAFWPSVIKNAQSLKEVIRKSDKLFVFASPFWISLITLSTLVFISFFGKAFPLRWSYVILFSINTFMGFLFSVWLGFLNIDNIRRSVIMNGIFVTLSVGVLIATKSVVAYILVQIILQVFLIYKSRIFLMKDGRYGK